MSVSRPKNLVSFGCLHPVQVTCPDGSLRFVPCRKCAYCRTHASDTVSQLGTLELLDNPCSLFVTLTYRNSCVPKGTLIYDGNFCNLIDPETGEIIETQYHSLDDRKFLGKISKNYVKRFPSYFSASQVPYIKISHVQQYVARIRERFRRKFGKKYSFRYLYCCEYGETTYRPHFHILLFCKYEEPRAYLYSIASECWHYGNVVSKYYYGNSSRYLTTYCSGTSVVSPLYCSGRVKSCARHSVQFGCSLVKKNSRIFDKFVCGCPLSFSLSCDGKDQTFNFAFSLQNSIFPRCRDFSRLDDFVCLKRYRLAFGFNNLRPSDIANKLTDEIIDYQNCPFAAYPRYFNCFGEKLKNIFDRDVLYTRVYRDVLISKKFLASASLYSHNCHSFHLFKTRQFYGRLEVLKLQNQYEDIKKLRDDGATSDDFVQLESWFLDHGVCLPRISDYTKTRFFFAWKSYCTSRLLDLTKFKKIKERFTLKDYD